VFRICGLRFGIFALRGRGPGLLRPLAGIAIELRSFIGLGLGMASKAGSTPWPRCGITDLWLASRGLVFVDGVMTTEVGREASSCVCVKEMRLCMLLSSTDEAPRGRARVRRLRGRGGGAWTTDSITGNAFDRGLRWLVKRLLRPMFAASPSVVLAELPFPRLRVLGSLSWWYPIALNELHMPASSDVLFSVVDAAPAVVFPRISSIDGGLSLSIRRGLLGGGGPGGSEMDRFSSGIQFFDQHNAETSLEARASSIGWLPALRGLGCTMLDLSLEAGFCDMGGKAVYDSFGLRLGERGLLESGVLASSLRKLRDCFGRSSSGSSIPLSWFGVGESAADGRTGL